MIQEQLLLGLTPTQKAVLMLVGMYTKGNEITGKTIANSIGMRPRDTGKEGADLRSVVNALRRKGFPICANGKGYYYPTNQAEIDEYAESLRGRIRKEQEALAGIEASKGGYVKIEELPKQDVVEI